MKAVYYISLQVIRKSHFPTIEILNCNLSIFTNINGIEIVTRLINLDHKHKIQQKGGEKDITISSSWRQTWSEDRPKRRTRTLSRVSLIMESTSVFFVRVSTT